MGVMTCYDHGCSMLYASTPVLRRTTRCSAPPTPLRVVPLVGRQGTAVRSGPGEEKSTKEALQQEVDLRSFGHKMML